MLVPVRKPLVYLLTNKPQVAGQDAVSAALEYMVRQLSKHAEVQSRLHLELLSSVRPDEERSLAMIDNLPYLNAVVMESLRTVDTISSYQTRVVPKGGCSISGYFLPEGVSSLVKLILCAFLVTYSIRPSSHANHTSSTDCPTCSPTQTTSTPRDGYFLTKATKHCQSIYGLTRAGPRAASDVTFLSQVGSSTLLFISKSWTNTHRTHHSHEDHARADLHAVQDIRGYNDSGVQSAGENTIQEAASLQQRRKCPKRPAAITRGFLTA